MIVITTPTGSIGRQVLQTLLASDAPLRVTARDPARLPLAAKGRVDVVQGSHADADVVQRAFQGAEGVFRGTHDGDRKMPTCATRDIAAVAARYLLDPTWTGQAEAPVLGPEDLSAHDMAAILTEVLGKPVRYQQMPVDALAGRVTGNGMSEAYVRGYVEMMVAKGAGLDNAAPRTAEATTPTSFRQWCEEVLKPAVTS